MDWPSRLRRAGITLLHIDAVKQGVKWSVLLLLLLLLLLPSHSPIAATYRSPLPCKTNMRRSRCLKINRQGPHERFLICVVMGTKAAQQSKDAWWCCVCKEEGYLHPSIDYHRGRAHLPAFTEATQERWLRWWFYVWQDIFILICLGHLHFRMKQKLNTSCCSLISR